MGLIVRFKTNPTIERIETRPTFECPECGTPLLIDRMKLANGEYEVAQGEVFVAASRYSALLRLAYGR